MVYKLTLLITLILISLACVVSTDPTPVPNPTVWGPTQTETFTPTPTSTPSATPSVTPTPTLTLTPTIDWSATPTQLTGSPPILEATPLGGEPYIAEGWQALPSETYFKSANNLKIRLGPGTDYSAIDMLYAGNLVLVYAVHYWEYTGDRWLCLDEPNVPVGKEFMCLRNVAYIVDSVQWGDLYLPTY